MIITFTDYEKLEKVEVGEFMGRWDCQIIERSYTLFTKFMEKISSISYDPLDLLNELYNEAFLEDYNVFVELYEDIDHRLANVSKTCFEKSDNLMSLQKVNF